MSSVLQPYLSKCGEAVVRKLHKTLRATSYEDPVDQETFLVASAKSLVRLRPQVLSFALVSDLGECVFTLRSMLHPFNAPLGTPSGDAYVSIQDFAGEIMMKQQEILDRKLLQAERARAANDAAARLEHQAVLAQAVHVKEHTSPEEDFVSIPSSDEDSAGPDPPLLITPAPSPIVTDLTNNTAINQAQILSPLHDLDIHLARLSLGAVPNNPPHSPLSPNLSLPNLVPDFCLTRHKLPVKGGALRNERIKAHHKRNAAISVPVVECNTVRLVPRPFGPLPCSRKLSYVDDWLQSTPRYAASPAPKRKYIGSSKPSANPNRRSRRPVHKKTKRCYHCAATDHLLALCPFRQLID
ncbi:hypothetical protein DFH08DRAFT_1012680 [Mycena albidolilacea]|uniref:Uncharacterized protein n=1 Tax=Mycena albidolilacea TaxID=1033008 RepID=A0AAD6ZUP2_9AGAR|nr:hypothetical protein DFH08DRAFT_1012680 [Mycena albidolilacea]